jgi:hypothetical protein
MTAISPTMAHLHVAQVHEGLRFSADDLEKMPLLGEGHRLQYREVWLDIYEDALAQHPISQNEFLVMLATEASQQPSDTPPAVNMRLQQLVVLRVEDWEISRPPLPNGRTHVLRCAILGSFNQAPTPDAPWGFTSQISLHKTASAFRVYAPSPKVLQGLVNGTLPPHGLMDFGRLRYNEQSNWVKDAIATRIAMQDMVTKRTAMLGKTRLGKSNVVKLIAQGILDYTRHTHNVGQLLFDVSGEYSNANPPEGEITLASHNPGRCIAYFLTTRQGHTNGKLLRFNFFQTPALTLDVMRELLPPVVAESESVRGVLTCRMSDLAAAPQESEATRLKHLRKVMLLWAVLDAAGFAYDPDHLKSWLDSLGFATPYNPGFSMGLRQAAYQAIHNHPAPGVPNTMASLMFEMNTMARFRQIYSNDPNLTVQGRAVFDNEESILMRFLCADGGQGPDQLRSCLPYHSPIAEDFMQQILSALDEGRTAIIDLSNAPDRVVRYFAQKMCLAIFATQEHKFNKNRLAGRYIQIYFEEAHDIFPIQGSLMTNVYSRFAKEGAKFHIGIAYATQSPTTINPDLLAQTENFFVGHLSSQKEVDCICELQVAFQGCENAIRFNRTPGLMQVLTQSHRYVVPMQANLYEGRQLITP